MKTHTGFLIGLTALWVTSVLGQQPNTLPAPFSPGVAAPPSATATEAALIGAESVATNQPAGGPVGSQSWVVVKVPGEQALITTPDVTPNAPICANISGSFTGLTAPPAWWQLIQSYDSTSYELAGSDRLPPSQWNTTYSLSPVTILGTNVYQNTYILKAGFVCGYQAGDVCTWAASVQCYQSSGNATTNVTQSIPSTTTNFVGTFSFNGGCGTNCDTPSLTTSQSVKLGHCTLPN